MNGGEGARFTLNFMGLVKGVDFGPLTHESVAYYGTFLRIQWRLSCISPLVKAWTGVRAFEMFGCVGTVGSARGSSNERGRSQSAQSIT